MPNLTYCFTFVNEPAAKKVKDGPIGNVSISVSGTRLDYLIVSANDLSVKVQPIHCQHLLQLVVLCSHIL